MGTKETEFMNKDEMRESAEIVVNELNRLFKRCRRQVGNDSFIAYIALQFLIVQINDNEGLEVLNRWIAEAILANTESDTNRKKH